jgi:hypothetical protein
VVDKRFVTCVAADEGKLHQFEWVEKRSVSDVGLAEPYCRLRNQCDSKARGDHRELSGDGVGMAMSIGSEPGCPASRHQLIVVIGRSAIEVLEIWSTDD